MKISQIAKDLNLKLLTNEKFTDIDIKGCYTGDLLSWVMSKAKKDDAWITVMGNVNAAAVASLCGVGMIILCENSTADAQLIEKANDIDLPVFGADKDAYSLCVLLSGLI